MMIPPVVKRVSVACTQADAFRYFTSDFAKWWPLASHSCVAFESGHTRVPAECVFETRPGGRILERDVTGREFAWGTVLVWTPPDRVVFSWHPGRDEQSAQTVEVVFTPAPNGAEVVLTHGGWERLRREDAARTRDGYEKGWEAVFERVFADYAGGQAATVVA